MSAPHPAASAYPTGDGSLEDRTLTIMRAALAGTPAARGYTAGDQNWWRALTPAERDELTLLTFAGISDAVRLIARHIDRSTPGWT